MFRSILASVLLLTVAGCSLSPPNRAADNDAMFGPITMKIDPIFTQVKDWTGDGKPDGIEALIKFEDRFEDPTKAAGRVIFYLYDYRKQDPDARGKPLGNPWVGYITTLAEQKSHWYSTTRTYNFQLAYEAIRSDRNYVLEAQFDKASGGRFFDKIVLVGESVKEIKHAQPASLPSSAPGGRTPQP